MQAGTLEKYLFVLKGEETPPYYYTHNPDSRVMMMIWAAAISRKGKIAF